MPFLLTGLQLLTGSRMVSGELELALLSLVGLKLEH
jgi:hypothetical protein